MEKEEATKVIRERVRQVTPLPDEPDFAISDDTINRFLKAYDMKVSDAEKALLETIEYRRQNQPLRTRCRWCHETPGFHSMRQVGHDQTGRPVVYANFSQAAAHKNTLEDIMSHVMYLIENAKVTMAPGVSTWVFVIDCSGMTLSVCSPKIGLKVVNLLSAHYPERLGLIICVNHNPIFHAFWKAIKKFLAPNTVSKMRLIRSEPKIRQAFASLFPEDLANWMWEEISRNKAKPLSPPQQQFWSTLLQADEHDPRGCPSYVENHVNGYSLSHLEFVVGRPKRHCPHPNIAIAPGTNLEHLLTTDNHHHFHDDATSSIELSMEGPSDDVTALPDDFNSEPDETDEDETVNPPS